MGQYIANIKVEKNQTPRKIGNKIKRSIRSVIANGSYRFHPRHGPYRRGTSQGLGDALTVIKVAEGAVALTVIGVPANYAVAVEDGHKFQNSSKVARGTGYFRKGFNLAKPDIQKEVKQAGKRILRK